MLSEALREQAFKPPGKLCDGKHDILWKNLEQVCVRAGIGGRLHYVWEALAKDGVVSQREIDFVINLRKQFSLGKHGLLYLAGSKKVHERMLKITGALLRNYIDARCMSLQQVLTEARESEVNTVEATVLLIPDFHTPSEPLPGKGQVDPKPLVKKPEWVIETMQAILQRRVAGGLLTFVSTADEGRLLYDYGKVVPSILENYLKVGVNS